MRIEESLKIKSIIRDSQIKNGNYKTIINLGCGDIKNFLKSKPYVKKNVFDPLKKQGAVIINVDSYHYPNIDFVLDLTKLINFDFLKKTKSPRLYILANVLEHIPSEKRLVAIKNIYNNMKKNDSIIITVPHQYPYHPCPIDTLYRPLPNDIKKLLPFINWKSLFLVNSGSYKDEFKKMYLLKKIGKLLKLFWIFQSPNKYINQRSMFLFKKYQISIAFGTK